VQNVCELLAAAHLHDAFKLKAHAFAFFMKGNAKAIMETAGWRELAKNIELVNFVVKSLFDHLLDWD
jgi:hypothetical protein